LKEGKTELWINVPGEGHHTRKRGGAKEEVGGRSKIGKGKLGGKERHTREAREERGK